jgi:hypothetical protein
MAVLVAATLASAMVATAAHGDDEAADATYTLERLGPSRVTTASTVTERLSATGEDGKPIAGLSVRFERTGPGGESAASCSVQALSECDVTDETGVAHYTFGTGISTGDVEVRAEIYSPEGVLVGQAGPDVFRVYGIVDCRGARAECPSGAYLTGHSKQGRDVVRLIGPYLSDHNSYVVLLRRTGREWELAGPVKKCNFHGTCTFSVRDRNRAKRTDYLAVLLPTTLHSEETHRISLR